MLESEGEIIIMIDLIKLLKEEKRINDYRIIYEKLEDYELYYVHEKLETVRSVNTLKANVTIYVDNLDKRGDSFFDCYDYETTDDIKTKLERAISNASVINNEYYELPADKNEAPKLVSNLQNKSLKENAFDIAEAVFNALSDSKATLNATEIFVYKKDITLVNSKGINKSETLYSAMIETIPTWTSDSDSFELYYSVTFTDFDKKDITKKVKEKLNEVEQRSKALKPQSDLKVDVVLRNPEMSSLYYSIIQSCSLSSKYNHINLYDKGTKIQKDPKFKLNIKMMGNLKGASVNQEFDSDGICMSEVSVVEDSVVKTQVGSLKMAYYLKEKATGNLPNVEVEGSNVSEAELKKEPYLEVVSMSGIQVDLYSDYIGGEIRLAYYFDGEKITPVTGISISGKISENLETMIASKETTIDEALKGPKIVRLNKMSIM